MTQILKLVSAMQKKGKYYEEMACQFLLMQGLRQVHKNWLKPQVGEIDLIMIEEGKAWTTLVFVEVRFRKSQGYGDGLMSITKAKQNKLIKTAQCFLQDNPNYVDYHCRFDVIAFTNEQPTWIQDAFIASTW